MDPVDAGGAGRRLGALFRPAARAAGLGGLGRSGVCPGAADRRGAVAPEPSGHGRDGPVGLRRRRLRGRQAARRARQVACRAGEGPAGAPRRLGGGHREPRPGRPAPADRAGAHRRLAGGGWRATGPRSPCAAPARRSSSDRTSSCSGPSSGPVDAGSIRPAARGCGTSPTTATTGAARRRRGAPLRIAAAWNVKRTLKEGRLQALCDSAELIVLRDDFHPATCPGKLLLTGEDFAQGGSAELWRGADGAWRVRWARELRGRRPWTWGPDPR
jgi:hypothetical protein